MIVMEVNKLAFRVRASCFDKREIFKAFLVIVFYIYAGPRLSERSIFGSNISKLISFFGLSVIVSWVMVRDFNVIGLK